jgi:hypothetical protein
MKAYEFEKDGKGGVKPIEIPAAPRGRGGAQGNDRVRRESDEKSWSIPETETLSEEEFRADCGGCHERADFPVLCASPAHNMGAGLVMTRL